MRPLVGDGGDDRDMVVAPARDRDAGRLADRRVAALGADQQRRREQPAVRRARPGRRRASRTISAGRAGISRLTRSAAERAVAQRRAQQPVLEHHAERIVVGSSGVEDDAAGLEPVADPDRAGSGSPRPRAARRRRSPRASARRSWRPRWRGRHSAGASCVSGSAGSTTMAGEAVAVERDRQRQADQAAAEDDDVRALHVLPLAHFRRTR